MSSAIPALLLLSLAALSSLYLTVSRPKQVIESLACTSTSTPTVERTVPICHGTEVEIDTRFYVRLRARKVSLGAAILSILAIELFGVTRRAIEEDTKWEGLAMSLF